MLGALPETPIEPANALMEPTAAMAASRALIDVLRDITLVMI